MRLLLFQNWIHEQAVLRNVDGCTGVTNWNRICCLQHDLEFQTGKDAVSAYRFYLQGAIDPWGDAEPTTFEDANKHFKHCNIRESKFGYWNPFAWARYLGVRSRKTRAVWDRYRAAEVTVH